MRQALPFILIMSACAARWMGPGAPLPELVEKTQTSVEAGEKVHDYIGVDTRAERAKVEAKLLRAQEYKGTNVGAFHWAALQVLTKVNETPAWATRFDIEATVLTTNGLASWEQRNTKDKSEDKAEKKKDKKAKKEELEGVTSKIELTRPKKGEPWRIEDLGLDVEGEAFASFADKKPFGSGASLSKEEANSAIFDVALFVAAPPFDSAALLGSFGGALAVGDPQAFFLVAAPEEKQIDDLATRLKDVSAKSREIQGVLSAAPLFNGLPANTYRLKVTLRGDAGEKLSYTIKKTKDGYRITSLEVRAKKDGLEIDLKPMVSDPKWSLTRP